MVAYIYNYSRNTVKSNRIKSCVFLFILFNQEICRRISRKDGMAMSNIFPVVITAQHNLCKIFAYKSKRLSPVDTYEKELSQSERKKFKSITFCIGGALLLLNYILFNFKIQIACTGITTAYLLESILLIFGKIFNKSKRRKALLNTEN